MLFNYVQVLYGYKESRTQTQHIGKTPIYTYKPNSFLRDTQIEDLSNSIILSI